MKKITFVPVGGLANRMRSMASAVALAKNKKCEVDIMWFCDWALNAPFSEIFKPFSIDGVSVCEAGFLRGLLYDRPRKRNFHLPRLFQKFYYDFCIYEDQIGEIRENNPRLLPVETAKRSYIASFYQFEAYETSLLHTLFRPVDVVMSEVDRRCRQFSEYTVGVHVRRTDHQMSTNESPMELFFDVLDKELAIHADMCIYLATDSEDVKAEMREHYGDRIITASSAADRDSVGGIRDGVVDMYVLARTEKIYGSAGSTFSEMAATLGGISLHVLRK